MLNAAMGFSSSSAGDADGVCRTTALSSSPSGSALGVDMTFTRRLRRGKAAVKVSVMLALLIPTAASFGPCVHCKAESSLTLFCEFQ